MIQALQIKIIITIHGKKKGEEIYFDYENIKNFSLIMAEDENNVLNYKINNF